MLEKYLSDSQIEILDKNFTPLKLNHEIVPKIEFLQNYLKNLEKDEEVKSNLKNEDIFLLTFANKWFVSTINEEISEDMLETKEVKEIKSMEELKSYISKQPYKIENFKIDVLNVKHGLKSLSIHKKEIKESEKYNKLFTQKGVYLNEEGVPNLISLDMITEEEKVYLDKDYLVKEEFRFKEVKYEVGLKAVIEDFYNRLKEEILNYEKVSKEENSLKERINIAVIEERGENSYYYDKYNNNGMNDIDGARLILLEDLSEKEVEVYLNDLFNEEVTTTQLARSTENINKLFKENNELNKIYNYFLYKEELENPVFLIGTTYSNGSVINVYYTTKNEQVYFFLTSHSNEGCGVIPLNNESTNYLNTERAVNFYNHKNKMASF